MTAQSANRTRDELNAVAARFGVAPEQARRDLLISPCSDHSRGTSTTTLFSSSAARRLHAPTSRISGSARTLPDRPRTPRDGGSGG